jgi:hypothetical protein
LGLNVELYDDENNIVDLKEVSTEEKWLIILFRITFYRILKKKS